MATSNWASIGSSNGLLPDGTKPLPEPIMTCHQRCSVVFTLEPLNKKCSWTKSATLWKLLQHLPGANELIGWYELDEMAVTSYFSRDWWHVWNKRAHQRSATWLELSCHCSQCRMVPVAGSLCDYLIFVRSQGVVAMYQLSFVRMIHFSPPLLLILCTELVCLVKCFKTKGKSRIKLSVNDISQDLSLRRVSDGYMSLQ